MSYLTPKLLKVYRSLYCVMESWLAPSSLIRTGNWDVVRCTSSFYACHQSPGMTSSFMTVWLHSKLYWDGMMWISIWVESRSNSIASLPGAFQTWIILYREGGTFHFLSSTIQFRRFSQSFPGQMFNVRILLTHSFSMTLANWHFGVRDILEGVFAKKRESYLFEFGIPHRFDL